MIINCLFYYLLFVKNSTCFLKNIKCESVSVKRYIYMVYVSFYFCTHKIAFRNEYILC